MLQSHRFDLVLIREVAPQPFNHLAAQLVEQVGLAVVVDFGEADEMPDDVVLRPLLLRAIH